MDDDGEQLGVEVKGKWVWKRPTARLWVHIFLHKRHDDFDLVPMLIGRGGRNMRDIYQTTNAKLRIRGRGSGHLEVDGKKEAPVPLMVAVTANKAEVEGFRQAVNMVVSRLDEVSEHYRQFCHQRRLPQPTKYQPLYTFGEVAKGADTLLKTLIDACAIPGVEAVAKKCTPGGRKLDEEDRDTDDEFLQTEVVDTEIVAAVTEVVDTETVASGHGNGNGGAGEGSSGKGCHCIDGCGSGGKDGCDSGDQDGGGCGSGSSCSNHKPILGPPGLDASGCGKGYQGGWFQKQNKGGFGSGKGGYNNDEWCNSGVEVGGCGKGGGKAGGCGKYGECDWLRNQNKGGCGSGKGDYSNNGHGCSEADCYGKKGSPFQIQNQSKGALYGDKGGKGGNYIDQRGKGPKYGGKGGEPGKGWVMQDSGDYGNSGKGGDGADGCESCKGGYNLYNRNNHWNVGGYNELMPGGGGKRGSSQIQNQCKGGLDNRGYGNYGGKGGDGAGGCESSQGGYNVYNYNNQWNTGWYNEPEQGGLDKCGYSNYGGKGGNHGKGGGDAGGQCGYNWYSDNNPWTPRGYNEPSTGCCEAGGWATGGKSDWDNYGREASGWENSDWGDRPPIPVKGGLVKGGCNYERWDTGGGEAIGCEYGGKVYFTQKQLIDLTIAAFSAGAKAGGKGKGAWPQNQNHNKGGRGVMPLNEDDRGDNHSPIGYGGLWDQGSLGLKADSHFSNNDAAGGDDAAHTGCTNYYYIGCTNDNTEDDTPCVPKDETPRGGPIEPEVYLGTMELEVAKSECGESSDSEWQLLGLDPESMAAQVINKGLEKVSMQMGKEGDHKQTAEVGGMDNADESAATISVQQK